MSARHSARTLFLSESGLVHIHIVKHICNKTFCQSVCLSAYGIRRQKYREIYFPKRLRGNMLSASHEMDMVDWSIHGCGNLVLHAPTAFRTVV